MKKIKFFIILLNFFFPLTLFSYINYEKLYIYSLYNKNGYNSIITPTTLPNYKSFNIIGGGEYYFLNLTPKIYNGSTDHLYSLFSNFILPFENNFLSLFVLSFNSYLFSERIIKISYATKIKDFSFGLSFKLLNNAIKANEYTEDNSYFTDIGLEKSNIALDVSGMYTYKKLRFNFTLYNLNQPDIGFVNKDILKTGCNLIISLDMKYFIGTLALYQNLFEKFQTSNLSLFFERNFFINKLFIAIGGNSSKIGLKTEVYIKKINKIRFYLTYQIWFPYFIANQYGNNLISVRITL